MVNVGPQCPPEKNAACASTGTYVLEVRKLQIARMSPFGATFMLEAGLPDPSNTGVPQTPAVFTAANPAEITAAVPFALAETAAGPPFSTNCGADQVCAWTELEQTNMPPGMKAFTTNKRQMRVRMEDRKSTRLNSSHVS